MQKVGSTLANCFYKTRKAAMTIEELRKMSNDKTLGADSSLDKFLDEADCPFFIKGHFIILKPTATQEDLKRCFL